MKKRTLSLLAASVMLLAMLTACGSSGETNTDASKKDEQTVGSAPVSAATDDGSAVSDDTSAESEAETEEETIKTGSYTLPSGVELAFDSFVLNDVTGNWRLATTSTNAPTAEYAIEYYENMFSSDDEIHFVVNFNLKTTTRISAAFGTLSVDTYEYVDGEEHDAKIMPSGQSLTSEVLDLSTGEPMQ